MVTVSLLWRSMPERGGYINSEARESGVKVQIARFCGMVGEGQALLVSVADDEGATPLIFLSRIPRVGGF